MEKIKAAFRRWKEKHWDLSLYTHDSEFFSMAGFNRPPLRRFWEEHRSSIKKALIWLLALIAGGVITKLLGLA